MHTIFLIPLVLIFACGKGGAGELGKDPLLAQGMAHELDGSKAKPVVEVFEVEIGAETSENAASAFPAPSEAPVVAKLSGFPIERSSLAKINVQVSDVSEYRWKLVPDPELCVDGLNFSDWVGTSQTLVADQSSFPDNQALALCVMGRNASGKVQTQSTIVRWLWQPSIPVLSNKINLVDGFNRVGLVPSEAPVEWLVVKSKSSLDQLPTPGSSYALNQALGNGTVYFVGPATALTDTAVRNGERWHYTFFAMSKELRYSAPVRKSLSLAQPRVLWVDKGDFAAPQTPVTIGTKSVCRVAVNGGYHPGSLTSSNNNLNEGRCRYEFAEGVGSSTSYQILVANKGEPMNLLRWVAADPTTVAGFDNIRAGLEDSNQPDVNLLYVCRSYNGATFHGFGKAGAHVGEGCLYEYSGSRMANASFDILTFR